MIPTRLIRTVPADTTDEVEDFWDGACALHPGWHYLTLRDPLDPGLFPLTGEHWERCTSGAQKAGLIRLEALWAWGGIYLDSDVELYRPLTPLVGCQVFAGWEDTETVPDAVIGAEAGHPTIRACIDLAIEWLERGPWKSGPGVTTHVFPQHEDVLLLPPGSFYPYHYSERYRRHENHRAANPWGFGAHHWAASWLPEEDRR